MKNNFTILTFVCFFLLFSIPGISQIKSKQNGNWNDGNTWNGGSVPGSGDNVEINHAVIGNVAITRNSGTTTTIKAGHSLAMRATYTNNGTTNVHGTFQLDGGGWANGNNDFTYHSGSYLVFNNGGNYYINSGQRFWPSSTNTPDNVKVNTGCAATLNDASKTINNLILWGGFDNKQSITINGNLEIHSGGYVATNPPVYNSGSTLIYESNNIYGIGTEWENTPANFPFNVLITNSTTLNYRNNVKSRTINGNLTIDPGSSLYMDYGDNSSSGSGGPLTINGNANIHGNFSMGKKSGDDLKILGDLNFFSGYIFNPNNRAVWFIKPSGTQNITTPSYAALTIPYIVIGTTGTGTTLQLGQDLTIDAPSGGNAIAFTNSNDIIDLEGYNLTIGQSEVSNKIDGPGSFKGSANSDLTLLGKGSVGALQFTSGYQQLRNLIINRTSGSVAATLATPLTLNGTGTSFANGLLEISDYDLTFNTSSSYTTAGTGSFIATDGSGKVIRNFNAPGSFTFPIGDNTGTAEYSPATINLTSVTETVPVSINLRNNKHTSNNSPTNYLKRYWSVTASGAYTGNADFNYTDDDIVGTESSLITAGWNGSKWNLYGNANAAANTLSVTGQTDLNRDFTAGDGFSSVTTLPENYFRSYQTGAWNVAGNWQSSPDGISNWVVATLAPDHNAQGILIQSSHTITINSTISLDHTSVEGTLQLNNGGTMNIYGSGNDLVIQSGGTLLVTNTANYGMRVTYENINTSVSVATDGKIIIGNGPSTTGTGYEGFATYGKNTWANGSKFIWDNGLAFGTSDVTFFPNNGDDDIPVFIIGPTAISGDMTNGASSPFNVKGLTVINANTTFKGGGNKIFRNGITGNATLTQDGSISDPGNFQITGNNAKLGGSNLTLNLTDILNLNSNVEVPLDSSVIINKNTGKSTSGSISKASNVVFTVNGIADMTTINMNNGSGSLTINGYLKTAAADGLKGSANATVTSGTVNVNSGSTIEYNATTNQKITTSSTLGNQKYYHLVLSGDLTKAPSNDNPIKIDDAGSLKITGPSTLIVDAMTNNIGPENTGNTTSFTMDGGRLRLGTLGFTGSGTLPSMKGAYNLTGGVIEFAGGTSSTSQSIRSGDSYNYFNIEASGTYVATSGGNVNLKDDGSFTVKNGGKFTININSIKGVNSPSTARVIVEGGGTINVGNTGGFNGRSPATIGDTTSAVHANISNIILNEGSTINYSRSSPPFTGTGSQPITTGGFTYQNLTLSGTGKKIAPFKGNLPINGNFTVQGAAQFDHDSGTVSFINTANAQDINAAGVTYPPVFYNLTNQNTQNLNIKNFISVKSELTLSDDSKLNLADSIRLISDNDQTASVAPINTAEINYGAKGAFIVERYIPNHSKAWQLLSVPTKGSTIKQSWQNNQNYYPGKGVNIPSPYWTLADPKGFDGSSYGHSMKTYDPGTDSYIGVTNTANNIDNPNGYFLFVRGDRSATDIWSPTTAVTLQTAGRLYAPTPAGEGPVSVTVPANSFAMVGNPYASAIKYDQLTFSPNLQDDYYIWDPQLTTTPSVYGLGAFRTITKDDGSATPSSGNYINGAIPPIQSGQAFFVYNPSATPGSVTFSESAKVSGSTSVFKPQRKEENEIVGLTVNLSTNPDGKNVILDGVRFFFNENYSAAVNQQDAQKLGSSSEGISIIAKPYPLSIERRPLPTENDTIFFGLSGMKRQTYSLSIDAGEMIKSGYKVFLHDALNKGTIELESAITKTDFVINTNPASSAPNRFFLTFKPAIPPFAFANEKATAAEDHITLTWRGLNQSQVASFHIEHSADGATFANAGSAEVKTGATADYLFTTIAPKSGINYYRVKAIMKDGSIMYSHVLSASVHLGASVMYISPNPVREVIRLHLYRMAKGDYRIQVYTMDGKRVLSRKITHAGGSANFNITPQGMAKGLYQLEIYKPDGSKASQLLMLDK
ncbi:MAG: hypothetical protein KIT66_03190 [Chitinophagaceae bacterium]|nr:hypothetical protein [Chitinophagaceae bacterium]